MVVAYHIMTIGMQDMRELLFLELDDDYFGVQDDSDASAAAASHAAAESSESEELHQMRTHQQLGVLTLAHL